MKNKQIYIISFSIIILLLGMGVLLAVPTIDNGKIDKSVTDIRYGDLECNNLYCKYTINVTQSDKVISKTYPVQLYNYQMINGTIIKTLRTNAELETARDKSIQIYLKMFEVKEPVDKGNWISKLIGGIIDLFK